MSRYVAGQPSERLQWLRTWFAARPGEWFSVMDAALHSPYFLATGVPSYARPWGSYNELLRRELTALYDEGVLLRRRRNHGHRSGRGGGRPAWTWEHRYNEEHRHD